jgi:hypothetical protein
MDPGIEDYSGAGGMFFDTLSGCTDYYEPGMASCMAYLGTVLYPKYLYHAPHLALETVEVAETSAMLQLAMSEPSSSPVVPDKDLSLSTHRETAGRPGCLAGEEREKENINEKRKKGAKVPQALNSKQSRAAEHPLGQ